MRRSESQTHQSVHGRFIGIVDVHVFACEAGCELLFTTAKEKQMQSSCNQTQVVHVRKEIYSNRRVVPLYFSTIDRSIDRRSHIVMNCFLHIKAELVCLEVFAFTHLHTVCLLPETKYVRFHFPQTCGSLLQPRESGLFNSTDICLQTGNRPL